MAPVRAADALASRRAIAPTDQAVSLRSGGLHPPWGAARAVPVIIIGEVGVRRQGSVKLGPCSCRRAGSRRKEAVFVFTLSWPLRRLAALCGSRASHPPLD